MKWLLALLIMWSFSTHGEPNFSQIKQQAELSSLAYVTPDEIIASLKADGLNVVKQGLLPDTQVSYFLTNLGGVQTIAIRGTANLQNVLVDLDVNLKLDEHLNIQVHQGFLSSATAVFNDVKPFLDSSQPVQTTGHSLGGAVATLLGMKLKQAGYALTAVTTFGQPKVTNVTGANQYSDLPLVRVVTPKDIVPLVPPVSPLQLKNLDIYYHNGQELILMEGNGYALTEGIKSMLRATKSFSSLPNEENLNAHKMTTYLALIHAKLANPVEVPYESGIRLFGVSFD